MKNLNLISGALEITGREKHDRVRALEVVRLLALVFTQEVIIVIYYSKGTEFETATLLGVFFVYLLLSLCTFIIPKRPIYEQFIANLTSQVYYI